MASTSKKRSERSSSEQARDMQEQLDELGRRIDLVREEARERGVLDHVDGEERFVKSGAIRPDLDDQTIAPPG